LTGLYSSRPVLAIPHPPIAAPKTVGENPIYREILALTFLRRIGIDWPQSLPVIAFAYAPEAAKFVTSRYSFRLLIDYGPAGRRDRGRVRRTDGCRRLSERCMLLSLPNIDRMGVVYQPAALAAILETTNP
jgi:hypothetical protein